VDNLKLSIYINYIKWASLGGQHLKIRLILFATVIYLCRLDTFYYFMQFCSSLMYQRYVLQTSKGVYCIMCNNKRHLFKRSLINVSTNILISYIPNRGRIFRLWRRNVICFIPEISWFNEINIWGVDLTALVLLSLLSMIPFAITAINDPFWYHCLWTLFFFLSNLILVGQWSRQGFKKI